MDARKRLIQRLRQRGAAVRTVHHNRARLARTTAILAAASVVLAGCGGPAAEEGAAGSEFAPLALSMPVVPPNFHMLQPWLAQELGLFDKYGIEVEIVSLETGVDALRGAEAGSADIAAVPTPTLINAVAHGAEVKAYHTYTPGLDAQMVATADVASCDDLRGKVLGIDEVGGYAEVLTKFFYSSCGLTQDDVEYGSFPGAEGQAMGQGQASSGVLSIDEAANVIAEFPDADLQVLANLWEVVPEWHNAGFASPTSIITEKREELVRFVAANYEATAYMYDTANKDEVVEIAWEVTGVDATILADTYDIFVEDEIWTRGCGGYPEAMVAFTAAEQVELGNIDSPEQVPAYDEIVDTSICEDAEALVESGA